MVEDTDSYFAKTEAGYIIIENVPCYRCKDCGEVVYSAFALENIEKILSRYNKISSKINIVDYGKAA